MDEVLVRYGDSSKDTAVALLGAADELGYEPYVVRHQPEDNGFRVPEDVAEKAKADIADLDAEAAEQAEEDEAKVELFMDPEGFEPAESTDSPKKTTTKKAAAKKTAKKTASNK